MLKKEDIVTTELFSGEILVEEFVVDATEISVMVARDQQGNISLAFSTTTYFAVGNPCFVKKFFCLPLF